MRVCAEGKLTVSISGQTAWCDCVMMLIMVSRAACDSISANVEAFEAANCVFGNAMLMSGSLGLSMWGCDVRLRPRWGLDLGTHPWAVKRLSIWDLGGHAVKILRRGVMGGGRRV